MAKTQLGTCIASRKVFAGCLGKGAIQVLMSKCLDWVNDPVPRCAIQLSNCLLPSISVHQLSEGTR